MASAGFHYQKNRTTAEKRLIEIQEYVDSFGALQSAGWYIALTQIWKPVYKFFILNQQYFFLVTLSVYFLNVILYSIKFGLAANKNIGNTANLAYKVFFFLLYLSIIIASITISAFAGSLLFYISCFIDPFLNTLKAIYFLTRCFQAESQIERQFFMSKVMTAARFAIGGGLFAISMLILYSVAGVPLIATAIIGAIFTVASILLAPIVMKGLRKLYHWVKGDTISAEEVELIEQNEYEQRHEQNFYSKSVICQPLNKDALLEKMHELKQVLEWRSKPEYKHTWIDKLFSEHPKRRAKIKALNLMEDSLNKLANLSDQPDSSIRLSDGNKTYEFVYQDKKDLSKKLNAHIVKHYKGAYQSFFKDKGRVEHLCEHAFSGLQRYSAP